MTGSNGTLDPSTERARRIARGLVEVPAPVSVPPAWPQLVAIGIAAAVVVYLTMELLGGWL